MAQFDRTIPPGGEGKITLRVSTTGYQGKIHKSAKVYTNDPRQKTSSIIIKAFVKVPIYIKPRRVYLRGQDDRKISRTVLIKAKEQSALTLKESRFTLSKILTYRIEEVQPGKLFKIDFSNIPGVTGSYRGVLKLKTNYPEKPEITIWIVASFQRVPEKKDMRRRQARPAS